MALALAALHPDRVTGLVLVAPVSPLDRLGPLDLALAHPLAGPPLARAAFAAGARALALPPAARRLSGSLPGLRPDDVRDVARGWRDGRTWRSFLVEQRALLDELPDFGPAIRSLAVPAAVIVGERDRVTSPRAGRELAAALPHGRIVAVPTAGHLLPWQAPDVVSETIAETAARGP